LFLFALKVSRLSNKKAGGLHKDCRWSDRLAGGKVGWFGRLVCAEENVSNSALCCKLEREIEG
jgi:hypothetical protein